MKLMIQIATTGAEAARWVHNMETQGYTAVRVEKKWGEEIHFTVDGKTSPNYSATIYNAEHDDGAYIGMRPA